MGRLTEYFKYLNTEPHDFTTISVNYVEFPNEDDVIKAYNDEYGNDYDKVIFELS